MGRIESGWEWVNTAGPDLPSVQTSIHFPGPDPQQLLRFLLISLDLLWVRRASDERTGTTRPLWTRLQSEPWNVHRRGLRRVTGGETSLRDEGTVAPG